MSQPEMIAGVIGGMGPEATVDFLRRVVAATPATDDVDHIRVLVDNNPKIPSRLAALVDGNGEDPLPSLIAMALGLKRQGAQFLVIPCNTAHYYLPRIAEAVQLPVIDMVGLAISKLGGLSPRPRNIGMLASPAVQKIGLYAHRLEDKGYIALFPDDEGEARMLGVIRAVKAGRVTDEIKRDYDDVASSLERAGADGFIIACTELSVLGPPRSTRLPWVDALEELAKTTVWVAKGAI